MSCQSLWLVVVVSLCLGTRSNSLRPSDLTVYEMRLNDSESLDVNLEGSYNISGTNFNDMNSQSLDRLEKMRESQKQRRIHLIQVQILERLGFQNKPNVTFTVSEDARKQLARKLEELRVEQDNDLLQLNENVYAERVQSFYPSCSLPRNTDKDAWDHPDNFHIYYNISSPRQMQGTSINVSSAKLRLFKNEALEETTPTSTTGTDEPMSNDQPWYQVPREDIIERDPWKVTVFQYLRPLRRNKRPKKRLLDSKTIPIGYAGWIEFNIQSSIRDWFENGNKNFGLEVILEDDQRISHNPASFIQNMNCSESRGTTDPPFPRNLFEDDPVVGENDSALFDNETYPTLDLRTVEFHGGDAIPQRNESEKRRKRQVACRSRNEKDDCCHETTFVTFEELGWDHWIIEPKGFPLGYCLGNCLPNDEIEDEDGKDCIPNEYTPLNLAYVDEEGTTRIGVMDDFLIKSCTCREASDL